MIREAELEEMEQKWREQNAAIMTETGAEAASPEMTGPLAPPEPEDAKEPELPLGAAPPP